MQARINDPKAFQVVISAGSSPADAELKILHRGEIWQTHRPSEAEYRVLGSLLDLKFEI